MFGDHAQTNAAEVIERERKLDVRQHLRQFMSATRLDAKQIARMIGGFEGLIEKWLQGNAVDHDLERQVEALLGIDSDWWPMPFDNLQSVFDLCRYAERRRRVGAVSGRSGYGKTMALKMYARSHGALYYCYDEASGAREIMKGLCRRAGSTDSQRSTIGEMRGRLAQLLRDNRRLLIIDQADTLPFKALEAIRSVYDEAECPLVFAGLEGRLLNRLMRRNERENAEQIFSRISAHITLKPPSIDDVAAICARFRITGARAQTYIYQRAAVGGYRYVRTLCEDAADVAAENGIKGVTLECVQKAATYLITTVNPADEALPQGE